MAKKKAVEVADQKEEARKQRIKCEYCEKELRKYVKRSGGFRKDISTAGKKQAREMLELLGRTKLVWDQDIIPV